MKILKLTLIFVIIISCKRNESLLQKHLKEFIGTEISLQANFIPLNFRDSLTNCRNFLDSKKKIIVYIDSSNCTMCRIKRLLPWEGLVKSFQNKDISLIFIFNTQDIKPIKNALELYHFRLPYFIDIDNKFKTLNNLPPDETLSTFMVNENKVVLAGDPLNNSKLRKIYINYIKKHI